MNKICDDFHKLYEAKRIWKNTTWLGIPIWKFPFDAFIIQELIYKIKPDYVIETGTNFGGSALFYASILELIGAGTVITIDKEKKEILLSEVAKWLFDTRIIRLIGDSVSDEIIKQVYSYASGKKNIVILDSWHSKEHVLKELNLYSQLVPVGSYIIIEDSHVNNHPVPWQWGEGPYEAVQEFLKSNNTFAIDKNCEKLLITYNPNGFLRRVLHGNS